MSDVTIIFKSGAKVHIRCEDLHLNKLSGEALTSLTITKGYPRQMFIDLAEVAAVYEGKA